MSQLRRRKEEPMWNVSQSIPFICTGKKIPLLSRKRNTPATPSILDANNYSITLPMTRLFALDMWSPYLAHYPYDHRSRRINKESITLIWFDLRADDDDRDGEILERLCAVNDFSLIYHHLEACCFYAKSVYTEKMLLITSNAGALTILPALDDLVQLDSVFIFNNDETIADPPLHAYPTTKLVGIFNDWANLEKAIIATIMKLRKHMDMFTYFDKNQTSTYNITEQQADFLWIRLFNDMIHHLPHDQNAKQEMIDACRDYYRGNQTVLAKIDEFERTYHIDNCIRWYTKDTFIYRLINKALRTQDVEQLYVFRYYITDLSTSLNQEYSNFHSRETILFYRGATISHAEFEKLKENQNHLISINGYFSTSRSRAVAEIYVGSNTSTTNGILFEIKCHTEMNVIFADISHYSEIPDEEEVLFDLGAAFQIDSVTQDHGQCPPIWIVKMTASNERQNALNDFMRQSREEVEDESSPILFGALLNKMGQYEKCIRYFQNLLRDSVENTNIARIHFHLGDVYDNNDDYVAALEHFEIAHKMVKNRTDDVGLKELAYIRLYKSIVLNHQENYSESLEYSKKALKSFEQYHKPSSNHRDIASCLFTIAQSYFGLSEFDLYEGTPALSLLTESLHYAERTLSMQQACLPVDHSDMARTLTEISKIRYFMKDIHGALEYGQKSLTILRKCLPADHLEIAILARYMATYYYEKNDLNLALNHFEQCLTIQRRRLPLEHMEIARTERHIARVLGDMGQTEQALQHLREGLPFPPDEFTEERLKYLYYIYGDKKTRKLDTCVTQDQC